MLEDYKYKQSVAYEIMMQEIKNNHVSHAYIIDENNCSEAIDIVMAFVKEILCSQVSEREASILRKRIDDGNYPEIVIIEPDGMLIKKQQILDLQQEFSREAIEGTKRIYVIRDADKMRTETANSMLKFLEEPDVNVVAILMTNNYNCLLSTIVSRCQIIRLNNNGNCVADDEIEVCAMNTICGLEKNGIHEIVNEQELIFSTIGYKDREKMVYFFDKMIDMYYDILKIFNGDTEIKFSEYIDRLTDVSKLNTNELVLKKISILLELKDSIKYNVNLNLLIDNMIVRVGGKYESSWS